MRLYSAILITAIFGVTSAGAQACDENDCMGFYFDREATISGLYTTGSMQQVTGYLCISNPSDSGGVSAWECELIVEGNVIAQSWTYNNGMNCQDVNDGLFMVGVGMGSDALMPNRNTTLLATGLRHLTR